VRAIQCEGCFRVVERQGWLPLFGRMAGFAGQLRLVRIGVTRVARARSKLELTRRRRQRGSYDSCDGDGSERGRRGYQRLVAIVARDCAVFAGKRKSCLTVPRDGKGIGLETSYGVAGLAVIRPGSRREFPAVCVVVARVAKQLPGGKHRILAPRGVTGAAFHLRMLPPKREHGLIVRLPTEQSGLKAGFVVTGRTVGARRTAGKLASVNIGVAIPALTMRDGPVKIGALVTFAARHIRMPPFQWKGGEIMREPRVRACILPATGAMAGVAGASKLRLLKGAFVRICVATLTAGRRSAPKQHGFGGRLFPISQ